MIKLHCSASATSTWCTPDTKKPVKVTFYVADKSGSTLLSCATSLKLDLIKLQPRLGVPPPPRVKIITSQADRASPINNWVTKGKIMFDEMMKSAPTTPTMDCTTSGEKGQLQEAPTQLLLVLQTSAIPCFNCHDEICPSGYINQPQIGCPTSASQILAAQHHKKTAFQWSYEPVTDITVFDQTIKMIPGSSLCDQNSVSYSHICDFQLANLSATKSATWHAKISHPTCTPNGISMSFPVDLERTWNIPKCVEWQSSQNSTT